MTDYTTRCAWCHNDLSGGYIEGPNAYSAGIAPDATRYCSARCVRECINELFHRRKGYDERWPRYSVEVPPEIAVLLDSIVKRQLGVNQSAFSRPNLTRRALRELLQQILNVPDPAVPGDADEVPDAPELPAG